MSSEHDDDLYSNAGHSGSAVEEALAEAQEQTQEQAQQAGEQTGEQAGEQAQEQAQEQTLDQDIISPTDGYFRGNADEQPQSPTQTQPGASQGPTHETPHIPDVLVEDPSLQEPTTSAKEAEARQQAEDAANLESQSAISPLTRSFPSLTTAQATHQPFPTGASSSQAPTPPSTQPGSVSPPVSPRVDRYPNPSFQHGRTTTWHSVPAAPFEAPPAYTSSRTATSYQTFSHAESSTSPTTVSPAIGNHESDEDADEHSTLLSRDRPTVNNVEDGSDDYDSVRSSRRSTKAPVSMKTCLTVLVSCVLSSIITSSVFIYAQHPKTKYIDVEPIRSAPAFAGDQFEWKPVDGCRNTPAKVIRAGYPVQTTDQKALTIYESIPFRIGSKSRDPLIMLQSILSSTAETSDNETTVKVMGDIYIRPWPGSTHMRIMVEGVGNDPRLSQVIELGSGMSKSRLFIIRYPEQLENWDDPTSSPCFQGRITVLVPPEAELRDFTIAGQYFNIHIEDGVDLSVGGAVSLASTTGNVSSSLVAHGMKDDAAPYKMQGVEWIVASLFGRVSGWFPVYDGLSLEAGDGANVQLGMKQPSFKPSEGAVVAMASKHGNITISTPYLDMDNGDQRKASLPMRDFGFTISAERGNITTNMPIGSSTIASCLGGTLNMTLQPILSRESQGSSWKSRLITEATTYDTQVRILEPIWTDKIKPQYPMANILDATAVRASVYNELDSPWSNLSTNTKTADALWNTFESSHSSTSGWIRLTYPDSWAGRVLWQSSEKGVINIGGDGLEIIREGSSTQQYLEARRNNGFSSLVVGTTTGGTSIALGRELEDVED